LNSSGRASAEKGGIEVADQRFSSKARSGQNWYLTNFKSLTLKSQVGRIKTLYPL
jgi:hypothetical protein